MKFLGYSPEALQAIGGMYTAQEIEQQPDTWVKTMKLFIEKKATIGGFLNNVYRQNNLDIILTGAGTSAFIGKALEGTYTRNSGKRARAVATTDIVTHPEDYIIKDNPTLLISFARSGNSPESVAAVELANKVCKNIYHIFITCNPEGKLAKMKGNDNVLVFLLPPETDDKSLAMTSSFSCMLLSGILFSKVAQASNLEKQVEIMAKYGRTILSCNEHLKKIASLPFERGVFLGSGPQLGTAQESHLKLQELTDGAVICKHDSCLGLRHGPKAVINEKTLVAFLLSNKEYVSQYEKDLINASNGAKGLFRLVVGEVIPQGVEADYIISLSDSIEIEEEFLSVCNIIPAQILGFHKSVALGLKPDAPSKSGAIHRVVQGVTIYNNY